MATIFERVRKVVVEQLDVDEKDVVPHARFVDDLGADSLDFMELIMALEEEFEDSNPAAWSLVLQILWITFISSLRRSAILISPNL